LPFPESSRRLSSAGGSGRGNRPAQADPELAFLLSFHLVILVVAPILLFLSGRRFDDGSWLILGVFTLYTLGMYLFIRGIRTASGRTLLGYVLLGGDLLLVTVLVWAHGGLVTDAYNFYHLVIVGAGILFGLGESLGVAVAAGLLYGGAVLLASGSEADLVRVAIRTIYFCLTGFIAAYLASREKLHRKAREEAQRILSELQEEHTRLKAHARDMSRRAVTDGLTQLYNHTYFHQRFEEELARAKRYGRPMSLLMLDIDNFKLFNDTHGHLDGDRVLTKVASILAGAVRTVDIACRYGGEEFAVILPETGLQAAKAAGERIRHLVEEAFSDESVGGDPADRLTVSIGIAGFPVHASTRLELIEAADRALYRSKRQGKNRVSTDGLPDTMSGA